MACAGRPVRTETERRADTGLARIRSCLGALASNLGSMTFPVNGASPMPERLPWAQRASLQMVGVPNRDRPTNAGMDPIGENFPAASVMICADKTLGAGKGKAVQPISGVRRDLGRAMALRGDFPGRLGRTLRRRGRRRRDGPRHRQSPLLLAARWVRFPRSKNRRGGACPRPASRPSNDQQPGTCQSDQRGKRQQPDR
jgi:hypothetical protein